MGGCTLARGSLERTGKRSPDFRQYCRVALDEIEPGMLGVGGEGLSAEGVKQAQSDS